ncbi:MAG: GntR family transcriptional regulator, partial [Longimicrobiales bacterium]
AGGCMSVRKRQREAAERQALERLRGRILSGIHAGHLNPGDRLPSYREVAADAGVDLRAVARIYNGLEQEGLVEIRGRTGAYVAAQERMGGQVLAETARWVVGVLSDGWRRRVPVPDLPDLVRRCVSTVTLRCTCVDSTEDQLVSQCSELHDDFGLDTSPLHLDRVAQAAMSGDEDAAPELLRNADLLATSTFHVAAVRPIALRLGKPLITVRLDPDLTRTVEQHLETNELTVICIDARFAERVRSVLGGDHPDRIHALLATERAAIARLEPDRPVLVSRAARRQLEHVALPPDLLPPTAPVISPDSAADVIETIVRLNLEAIRRQTYDRGRDTVPRRS